jgi:hypothetical protein
MDAHGQFAKILTCIAGLCLFAGSADAEERLGGLRIGMNKAQVDSLLKGHCPDQLIDDPAYPGYMLCQNGKSQLVTKISNKDRLFYISMSELSVLPAAIYSAKLAADTGFTKQQKSCELSPEAKYCWVDDQGNEIFAGVNAGNGIFNSLIINIGIYNQDGGPNP